MFYSAVPWCQKYLHRYLLDISQPCVTFCDLCRHARSCRPGGEFPISRGEQKIFLQIFFLLLCIFIDKPSNHPLNQSINHWIWGMSSLGSWLRSSILMKWNIFLPNCLKSTQKTQLWRSFFLKQWVTFSGWEVSPTENRPVPGHAVYYIHRLGPGWCSGELLQTGLAVTSFTSPRHILQHTTGRHLGRNRYKQQYLLRHNMDNVSVCLMW